MGIAYIALAAVALPILFIMLVWVGVTALRLLRPEETAPPRQDATVLPRPPATDGPFLLIGARKIREDQRHRAHAQLLLNTYSYHSGDSDGFPEVWAEDLWNRRN